MRIRPVETSGLPMPFQRRGQGPVIVGSPDPLAWANKADGAKHAWDFIANAARWNGQYIGALANTPNWTFTRASTAYYRNSSGLLTSVASGVLRTGDRGALIEGAGTNLCLQSQTVDHAIWTKSQTTVSADAVAAPDGTTTADKLTEDTNAGVHDAIQSFTKAASATQYTATCYLKAGERTYGRVGIDAGSSTNQAFAVFNLSAGTIQTAATVAGTFTSGSATISALGNGWYRCSVTGTTGTETTVRVRIMLANASVNISYTGDGTSGLYLWGAQLEAAAFASSYIPTTTASATRAADSLTVTGVTGLDYPLSLYAEWEPAAVVGSPQGTLQVDSASNDRALLTMSSGALAQMYVQDGGVDQVNNTIAGAIAVGTVYKHAVRFAANDSQHARGGTLGTQDTSCSMPSAPTTIRLGSQTSSTTALYGYLRRLALFSRALSDGELQALTT